MPRKRSPPRLYLDEARKQWVVRDGSRFVRTGCSEEDRRGAEKHLAWYLGDKHAPQPAVDPIIDDVIVVYGREHLPKTRGAKNAAYHISNLLAFWSGKRASDITARSCIDYALGRTGGGAGARRDLTLLQAAIRYWHRHYGPLGSVPSFVFPAAPPPRERWLTRIEAERLRLAAMKWPHLYRFIVIGLLTGSRSGAILDLRWDWVDLDGRLMRRRAFGEPEDSRKKRPPVRISRALARLLRRWKRRDGDIPYVVHYQGRKVTKIKRSWRLACEAAGLTGVTPHTLRHTRATWLMKEGVDMWEAAGHLGMSIKMLQDVYGHHHPDAQGRASEV